MSARKSCTKITYFVTHVRLLQGYNFFPFREIACALRWKLISSMGTGDECEVFYYRCYNVEQNESFILFLLLLFGSRNRNKGR